MQYNKNAFDTPIIKTLGGSASPQGGSPSPQGGSPGPQGVGPDPNNGGDLSSVGHKSSEDSKRGWSKAGASTGHDYGTGSMVDSDDYSEYNSDEHLIDRGIEKDGFVKKSHAAFINTIQARISSIAEAFKKNPAHHEDITGLKPKANVVHEPKSENLQFNKDVWARGVKHMNEHIFEADCIKAKPEADTNTLDGKALTPGAKVEAKGAILYFDRNTNK